MFNINTKAAWYPFQPVAVDSANYTQLQAVARQFDDILLIVQPQLMFTKTVGAAEPWLYAALTAITRTDNITRVTIQLYTNGQIYGSYIFSSQNSFKLPNGSFLSITHPQQLPVGNYQLQLSINCLLLLQPPVTITLHYDTPHKSASSVSYPYSSLLASLTFASKGYNTVLSITNTGLSLSCGSGFGLGQHDTTVWVDATQGQVDQYNHGLYSINGIAGSVLIKGAGHVVVTTTLVSDTLTLSLSKV